ncbi:IclR family transcriptional regulator [Nonomuraea sp. NPDC050153]|uniref:IclR family transcriptional regulator n=1 Tax=Nonomuraea sp. NPDC050153 TaxID=3364359 RepID=UPI0037AE6288
MTQDALSSRIATVLAAFRAGDDAVGAAELARRTGLPKSTVHRIMGELVSAGLLERRGRGASLGLALFEIGQRVPRQRVLRDAAVPFMSDLREATRQTVHLAVLDGREVVYVDKLTATGGPPLPSAVGGRVPATATGVGKAILAFSPPATVGPLLAEPLPRLTARSITAPGLLSRELRRIRREGVAYDREESGPGITCVASPILGPDDLAIAALSLSGWSNQMRLARYAPAVRTAALALTRALRH